MTMSHFIFKAYKSDLFGARYVWILIGTYTHGWWSVPDPSLRCTKEEMKKAVAYTFIFNNRIFVGEDKKGAQNRTLSGLVSICYLLIKTKYLLKLWECHYFLSLCRQPVNFTNNTKRLYRGVTYHPRPTSQRTLMMLCGQQQPPLTGPFLSWKLWGLNCKTSIRIKQQWQGYLYTQFKIFTFLGLQ